MTAGPPPVRWVCSSCGATAGIEPQEALARIDDRYTTGHCITCTPWPRPRKRPNSDQLYQPPRRIVQLVRSDVWDADQLRRRREREGRVAAVSQLDTTRKSKPLSDAERAAAAEALRYQLEQD